MPQVVLSYRVKNEKNQVGLHDPKGPRFTNPGLCQISAMTESKKAAALIVGAGIAGMQAALDIADAGFPVYLVDRELSIGGRMAQLDKTFPTLDCASCIITPKLVDVGRHPNIQVLTGSEVSKVEGQSGDFRVTIHHRARYVDLNKCVGCGLCAQVCPVSVPDPFNSQLSTRQAIYRLFPQAVPNAFGIQREGRAPCRLACPARQRVPGFITLVRERRYQDALQSIKLDNPFPGICGRVCPHPCEAACNRGEFDEPLNIRALKRFVADRAYDEKRAPIEPAATRFDERVAIVGSGPAGLTAAQDLRLAGYRVCVFEALPFAGGMLQAGIPEFRLPAAIVKREVQDILDLGVELKLNSRVDDLGQLRQQGFDAVLVAAGAQDGIRLPLEGADLDGVLVSTEFLRSLKMGELEALQRFVQPLGRVLILGGGSVAVDCARAAVRLGAQSVAMACLEEKQQMPAHTWDLQAVEAEGIKLHTGRTFKQILGRNRVTGVVCEEVNRFSFDQSGRLQVEEKPNSSHVIEADTVIFAVGQRVESGLFDPIKRTDQGHFAVDPGTWMTSATGVFAAGDAVTGTATVVEAIAAGHRAALSIHRFLHPETGGDNGRKDAIGPWRSLHDLELRSIKKTPEDFKGLRPEPRINPGEHWPDDRTNGFSETEVRLTEEEALAEAARCLQCGVCAECLQCLDACEANAIDHNQRAWDEVLEVGTIILATGFDLFDPLRQPNLGYGKYANVLHSLEIERLLSASGPTSGTIELEGGLAPQDVVFIQCVGSRDKQAGNPYCSRVCCMFTAKQAHLIRDRFPNANITVFYIDIRAFGKGFEQFHEHVRHERVRYRRGNVSEVVQGPNGKLIVRAEDTLLGTPVEVHADLVVLAVGLVARRDAAQTAQRFELQIGNDGFFLEMDPDLDTNASGVPGVFLAGACQGPKDILDTVAHAKAAAASAMVILARQGHSRAPGSATGIEISEGSARC